MPPTDRISISIPEPILAAAKERARSRGQSTSEYISQLLSADLNPRNTPPAILVDPATGQRYKLMPDPSAIRHPTPLRAAEESPQYGVSHDDTPQDNQ